MTTKRSSELPKEPSTSRDDLVYFERADPSVRLGLPARPNVEQQLIYYSRFTETRGEDLFLRLWHSAQSLIEGWECELLPDPTTDLKSITNPDVVTIIMWAGNQVSSYMNGLDALPKG
jgi:hypothetical protein